MPFCASLSIINLLSLFSLFLQPSLCCLRPFIFFILSSRQLFLIALPVIIFKMPFLAQQIICQTRTLRYVQQDNVLQKPILFNMLYGGGSFSLKARSHQRLKWWNITAKSIHSNGIAAICGFTHGGGNKSAFNFHINFDELWHVKSRHWPMASLLDSANLSQNRAFKVEEVIVAY